MLACPKGHKLDVPGQFFHADSPDGPYYCPECKSVLEKTDFVMPLEGAGLPWRTEEQKKEFIEAVAEAVRKALQPTVVVDTKKLDPKDLENVRPRKIFFKKW